MGRTKNKVKRYNISLNQMQKDELEKLMQQDAQTDVSNYFGLLIINERNRRLEAKTEKRPVGRPKKEEDEPDPRGIPMYPHPEDPKDELDEDEYKAWFIYRNQPVPTLPEPKRWKKQASW